MGESAPCDVKTNHQKPKALKDSIFLLVKKEVAIAILWSFFLNEKVDSWINCVSSHQNQHLGCRPPNESFQQRLLQREVRSRDKSPNRHTQQDSLERRHSKLPGLARPVCAVPASRHPKHQSGESLWRKAHFLSFQTVVEETVSREIYEDSHTLLNELLTEMSTKVDAGLSFKFTPTEKSMSNISGSVGGSVAYEKKTMIKEITESTNIKVHGRRQ